MPRSRRAVLQSAGVLAATATSGCLFGDGCGRNAYLTLDRATDDRLIEEFSDPISARALGPVGERIAANATRTGNATYEAADVGVENGTYRHDGTFHELTTTSVGSRPAVGFEADLEIDFDPTGTPSGPVVAFEDLPAVDRRALLEAFLDSAARRVVGQSSPSGRMSGSGSLLYPEGTTGGSVLVPEPEYGTITYRGGHLTVSVDGRVPDAELRTYRVESDVVADSREAFVRRARDRIADRGVVLADESLTADQRDLLEAAREDGYDECVEESAPEPLREVTAAIFGVEWDRSLRVPDTFVRYDGTWYEASLDISVG